jgi:hypothetical protein
MKSNISCGISYYDCMDCPIDKTKLSNPCIYCKRVNITENTVSFSTGEEININI